MKKLTSNELRNLYFDFFKKYNHYLVPSASLIPENDPTVLFTTAGMQPLVPYLMGETHPGGKRLVGVQKCLRTVDIEEIGDDTHLTSFEMLGNWSLGDYFKKESLAMSIEFLTSKDYLNIPMEKLYFTCFEGDEDFPKDMEAYNALIDENIDKSHIFFLPKEHNFWILGSGVGPCGPDTEIFYDTGNICDNKDCSPACDCGRYVEIWNNVFMEFYKDENGKVTKLKNANVDTGMGLDRTLYILNNQKSVYDTDLFSSLKLKLEEITNKKYEDNMIPFRIIMDHIRTGVFILGDVNGVAPSNVGQGYILRRLLRRAIRNLRKLEVNENSLTILAKEVIKDNKEFYPEIEKNQEFIFQELEKEETKFKNTLRSGERMFNKVIKRLQGNVISGEDTFKLFDTFGFPIEMTIELALEHNLEVDEEGFHQKFKEHQEKSKTLEAGTAKGGLADNSEQTIKYHTLTHIMLASLQDMFGDTVIQRGANINSERVRFDFSFDRKMTDEEKEELEQRVNDVIKQNIPVTMKEMTYDEAKKLGAHGTFDNKYGDMVKVYTIENVSIEICGGPHVKNTGELGTFKIQKEQSSAAGVRRIRAILE